MLSGPAAAAAGIFIPSILPGAADVPAGMFIFA